jgi:hypothetical protein
MSWSNAFIQQLDSQAYKPVFQLRILNLGNFLGMDFSVYSTGQAPLKIERSGVSIGGTRVIPSRWSVSFGGFQVTLAGNIRELLMHTRKGAFAELNCSINGLPFERVAIGQLQSITRMGLAEKWVVKFRDLLSAFQNTCNTTVGAVPSPSSVNPTQQPLFWRTGIKTPLSSAYSVSDNTLSVVDNSAFEKETGKNGILRLEKNSAPDEAYYMEYSSLDYAANTFTTVPAGGSSPSSAYPSKAIRTHLPTSAGGSSAYTCVRLQGHPSDIIGKIITSTGAGNNGALDTLPVSWSIGGLFHHSVFDKADADLQKQIIRGKSSSSYSWRVIYDQPAADGIREIIQHGSQVGQWPVLRQGSISWRGCSDPDGQGMSYSPVVIDTIYDYDIMSIKSHEIYSSSQANTNVISTVQYATPSGGIPVPQPYTEKSSLGQVSGRTQSLPAKREVYHFGVFIYDPDETVSDLADGDLDRVKNWDHWTWEKLTLELSMRKSHLVAGDIVEITSRYLYGLQEGYGQTYYNKRAMVIGSSFDLSQRRCIIEFAIISGRNK